VKIACSPLLPPPYLRCETHAVKALSSIAAKVINVFV
jgi:hypothetical protein